MGLNLSFLVRILLYFSCWQILVLLAQQTTVEQGSMVLKEQLNKIRNRSGDNIDLIFVVDSSGSVGAANFISEINFVDKLLADFTISKFHTKVAFVKFSSTAITEFNHISNPTAQNNKCVMKTSQLNTKGAIAYNGGSTNTKAGLQAAQEIFKNSQSAVSKVVFLVTDGVSDTAPSEEARKLKNMGVTIFSIGIQGSREQEMKDISSDPDDHYAYLLPSFDKFDALARRALNADLGTGDTIDAPNQCTPECDTLATCVCGLYTGHYECICPKGYYGLGTIGQCMECPAGTYRISQGVSDVYNCINCPVNMTSPTKSTSVDQCTCETTTQCRKRGCPKLEVPSQGSMSTPCENEVNGTCYFTCFSHHFMIGSETRVCLENGTWSGEDTKCEGSPCPQFDGPFENGQMNCTGTAQTAPSGSAGTTEYKLGAQCLFKCDDGYFLEGQDSLKCNRHNHWDFRRPTCNTATCSNIDKIEMPKVIVQPSSCTTNDQRYGSTCEFGCPNGYNRTGQISETVCNRSGQWTNDIKDVICRDIAPLNVTCPRNIDAFTEQNENFALIKWSYPTVTDSNEGRINRIERTISPAIVTIKKSSRQPFKFTIGNFNISFFAADTSNNKYSCSFMVSVKDNTKPKIDECQEEQVIVSSDPETQANFTEPVFTDNSGDDPTITKSSLPLDTFPQGSTPVFYEAVDSAGNKEICNFIITVQGHKCKMPTNFLNGFVNCTNDSTGSKCRIECDEGHVLPVANAPDYYQCNLEGKWIGPRSPLQHSQCTRVEVGECSSGRLAVPGNLCGK